MARTYEFKILMSCDNIFTVVKFYRSPNLGECHVGYLAIASNSADDALKIAKEAM